MPLKILHISDVHLGVEKYGTLDPSTGLGSRLGDFLHSFDQAVDAAIAEECDLMVFAGDAYKTRDPNPTIQREFARRIRRLGQAGIHSFLLVGNHDLPLASARAHTMEIFDTLGVTTVTVARKIDTYIVPTRKGNVQIVAVPWVTPHTLLTKDEYRLIGIEQLNRVIAEKVENVIEAEAERLDPTMPAIFTMHGTVAGSVYSSERDIMLGKDIVVHREALQNPAFSYVALGHIHKHQVLHDDPAMVYCGSLERIDFGEEGEPKGYIIAEFEKRNNPDPGYNHYVVTAADARFIETDARRFFTLKVEAMVDNPTEAALRSIDIHRKQLEGAIVRVIIHTSVEHAPALRDAEIHRALHAAGVNYLASVTRDVERGDRMQGRDRLIGELPTLDALELYFKDMRKLPTARIGRLLEYAKEIIGVSGATASVAGNDMAQDRDGAGE